MTIVLSEIERTELMLLKTYYDRLKVDGRLSLLLSEIDDLVKEEKLLVIIAKTHEIEYYTNLLRQCEMEESQKDYRKAIKNNYEILSKYFTVIQLQHILSWYEVYSTFYCMEPSSKVRLLLETVDKQPYIISVIGQGNWNKLFTLIRGVDFLEGLCLEEDIGPAPVVHKELYTQMRTKKRQELIKEIESNPEIVEKIRKGSYILPYKYNGIIKLSELSYLWLPVKSSKSESKVVPVPLIDFKKSSKYPKTLNLDNIGRV